MDADERKRLRELATFLQSERPGPWTAPQTHREGRRAMIADNCLVLCDDLPAIVADYCSAAHPQAVLALLDALDAAERERDAAQDELRRKSYGFGGMRSLPPCEHPERSGGWCPVCLKAKGGA